MNVILSLNFKDYRPLLVTVMGLSSFDTCHFPLTHQSRRQSQCTNRHIVHTYIVFIAYFTDYIITFLF